MISLKKSFVYKDLCYLMSLWSVKLPDDVDIRYLKGIIERFNGGPVGLDAIASSIQEEAMTLEDVYEP